MIAEPWDIGQGGYQLGHFPPGWAEWNDRFRDAARRFWRGDERMSAGPGGPHDRLADLFTIAAGGPGRASTSLPPMTALR